MKKTILAIAIPALFASAANAAVIYDCSGLIIPDTILGGTVATMT